MAFQIHLQVNKTLAIFNSKNRMLMIKTQDMMKLKLIKKRQMVMKLQVVLV